MSMLISSREGIVLLWTDNSQLVTACLSYAFEACPFNGAGGAICVKIVVGRAIRYISLMLIGWGALMIKTLIEVAKGLNRKFSVSFNFRSL